MLVYFDINSSDIMFKTLNWQDSATSGKEESGTIHLQMLARSAREGRCFPVCFDYYYYKLVAKMMFCTGNLE